MFQLHSTEDVFAKVASNMRKNHSRLQGYVVRRRVELMREIVDEVLDTFPSDLPFTGTDEDDYHIHAAATACQADLLLTDNDPEDITTNEEVHYEIISPDDFLFLSPNPHPSDAASYCQIPNRVLGQEARSYAVRQGAPKCRMLRFCKYSSANFTKNVSNERNLGGN